MQPRTLYLLVASLLLSQTGLARIVPYRPDNQQAEQKIRRKCLT